MAPWHPQSVSCSFSPASSFDGGKVRCWSASECAMLSDRRLWPGRSDRSLWGIFLRSIRDFGKKNEGWESWGCWRWYLLLIDDECWYIHYRDGYVSWSGGLGDEWRWFFFVGQANCESCQDQMCQGLNSHYFHIIGDGHQPNSRVFLPISGIPIVGWDDHPPKNSTFGHGTNI